MTGQAMRIRVEVIAEDDEEAEQALLQLHEELVQADIPVETPAPEGGPPPGTKGVAAQIALDAMVVAPMHVTFVQLLEHWHDRRRHKAKVHIVSPDGKTVIDLSQTPHGELAEKLHELEAKL